MEGQRTEVIQNLSFKDWEELLRKRKSALEAEDQQRGIGNSVIYRVDPSLKEQKSEPFDAIVVSLGLFHRRGDQSNLPTDTLKLDVVIKFLADTGHEPENWKDISARVVTNPAGMKSLYDGHWHLDLLLESIQSSLAVDAIFVTCFLLYFLRKFLSGSLNPLSDPEPATNKIFFRQHRRIDLMLFKDVFKLENQIPLELIRNVIAIIFRNRHPDLTVELCHDRTNEMVETICSQCVRTLSKRLPSFQSMTTAMVNRDAALVKLHECQHLLHCLAQAFWNGTEPRPFANQASVSQSMWRTSFVVKCYEAVMRQVKKLNPIRSCTIRNQNCRQLKAQRFQYLPTANKLHKYGIKIQGRKGFPPKFEKHACLLCKATLFLPTIEAIDDGTNEQWRNLLAFEDAYMAKRETERSFMAYLQFMGEFINTEEDVSVLCTGNRPVIRYNGLGDDKAVADLFNSVTKNHIRTNSEQWSLIRKELVNYHNATLRRMWFEFVESYMQKPWLVSSILAALILLVFTVLQAVWTKTD